MFGNKGIIFVDFCTRCGRAGPNSDICRGSLPDGMLVYAFLDSPVPPRTVFRNVAAETTTEECQTSSDEETRPNALEKAILAVLHKFPEAYRVVIEEMRRLVPEPQGAT